MLIKWKRTNVLVVAAVVSTVLMPPPMLSDGSETRAAALAFGGPTTLYVDDDGPSSSNGLTWQSAFTNLQSALQAAIFADLNRGGVVNVDDLIIVVLAWGSCP